MDKMIRFINSDYRELFSIPDGGKIKVTYPADDGREPAVRACKYMGEMHVDIGGNVYHIAEFAERMERIGAKYEPEIQVTAELAPFADGESKMFYRPREEGNLCVGQLRGDFGQSGDRFFHSWTDRDASRKTPQFLEEFQAVMYKLRQGPLKDLAATRAYCQAHPEAKLPNEESRYGFKLETDTRQYFLRCTTLATDYFYVFAHDKPAPTLEHSAPTSERADGYTSVLAAIEKGKNTPKPPKKAKETKTQSQSQTRAKSRKKTNGEEL